MARQLSNDHARGPHKKTNTNVASTSLAPFAVVGLVGWLVDSLVVAEACRWAAPPELPTTGHPEAF
jgi:hypothetical protein